MMKYESAIIVIEFMRNSVKKEKAFYNFAIFLFSKLSNVKYPTYTQKIDRRSNEKIENIYFSFQNGHIMLNTPITEVI